MKANERKGLSCYSFAFSVKAFVFFVVAHKKIYQTA